MNRHTTEAAARSAGPVDEKNIKEEVRGWRR
jgi:hypothetical protein